MTVEEVVAIILEQPGAVEGVHQGHPDFRVANKIFATAWPKKGTAVLRLPLDYAEQVATENMTKCKVVSRFAGMGWLSCDLEQWNEKSFRPLVELARSLMNG